MFGLFLSICLSVKATRTSQGPDSGYHEQSIWKSAFQQFLVEVCAYHLFSRPAVCAEGVYRKQSCTAEPLWHVSATWTQERPWPTGWCCLSSTRRAPVPSHLPPKAAPHPSRWLASSVNRSIPLPVWQRFRSRDHPILLFPNSQCVCGVSPGLKWKRQSQQMTRPCWVSAAGQDVPFFFWPDQAAYGISVPQPGIEPRPQQWKPAILTTRPPGNSRKYLWSLIRMCAFLPGTSERQPGGQTLRHSTPGRPSPNRCCWRWSRGAPCPVKAKPDTRWRQEEDRRWGLSAPTADVPTVVVCVLGEAEERSQARGGGRRGRHRKGADATASWKLLGKQKPVHVDPANPDNAWERWERGHSITRDGWYHPSKEGETSMVNSQMLLHWGPERRYLLCPLFPPPFNQSSALLAVVFFWSLGELCFFNYPFWSLILFPITYMISKILEWTEFEFWLSNLFPL